ncbi:hypothetical protein I6H07_16010 [Hafnia alvei]|uniref:hypothetical protein n=1 Tax=Hafnia alvei TaxID=569 RepID=UPI000B72047C|nr:hypothetical protein [Hafnia alvei]MBI0277284.1 hypothetical protein [Hafnia alvei]PNK96238.1 hypothetical protein CEQ28_000815 [Hafnia alvei]PNK97571.1 hypothetical protein CEQ28_008195 [Hafnia alvei]
MSIAISSALAFTASMIDKRSIDRLIEKLAEPAQIVSQDEPRATPPATHQEAMNMVTGSLAHLALLDEKTREWTEKVHSASQVNAFDESDEQLASIIADLEDSARSINNSLNTFKVLYFHVDVAPKWRPHAALYKDAGTKIIRCLSTMRNLHRDMALILRQHLSQTPIDTPSILSEQDMKNLITHSHTVWGIKPPKWS